MNRASMLANMSAALKHGKAYQEARNHGQVGLFDQIDLPAPALQELPEFDPMTRLWHERRVLGGCLSSHPVLLLPERALARRTHTCREYGRMLDEPEGVVVIALVTKLVTLAKINFVKLEDETGEMEAVVFRDEFERNLWALQVNCLSAVKLEPRHDGNRSSMMLQRAHKLDTFGARS